MPHATTEKNGRVIVDGSVAELLAATRDLLKDEEARAASLNARGTALTGFIGVVVSLAAAAGAGLGTTGAVGLGHDARLATGVLGALALVVLLVAVAVVVVKVLLPTDGDAIDREEVVKYPNWEFISQKTVMIQGHLMKGYAATLISDRARNDGKAKWLRVSYLCVLGGLVLVSAAGATATLDRYVGGSGKDPRPGRAGRQLGPARAPGKSVHDPGHRNDQRNGSRRQKGHR